MSGFDPTHRLWVEFKLKNESVEGFTKFRGEVNKSTESIGALRKELAEVRANLTVPESALTARKQMLALTREEVRLREEIALSSDREETKRLTTRLRAVEYSKAELGVQKQGLAMQERAANAAERKALAEERAAERAERAAAANAASARASVYSAARNAGHVGTNMMWGGVGVVAGLGYATQKAINFNQTALETDLALGGYNRSEAQRQTDIKALQRAAMVGSEATGFFSAEDILKGLKTVASAGARPLVEKYGMKFFTDIAPALSQYMDVVGRIKGEDANAAAQEAIQIAHMSGAYTPKDIANTLNASAAMCVAQITLLR